jgi:hypothetical protein
MLIVLAEGSHLPEAGSHDHPAGNPAAHQSLAAVQRQVGIPQAGSQEVRLGQGNLVAAGTQVRRGIQVLQFLRQGPGDRVLLLCLPVVLCLVRRMLR